MHATQWQCRRRTDADADATAVLVYVERGAASRHRALLHLHTHARAPPLAGKNKSAKRPLFAVCANRIVALNLLLLCYGGTQWHGSRVKHVNWMGIGMAFHLCAAAAKACKLQETMRRDCRPSYRFTNYYYYYTSSSTHQKSQSSRMRRGERTAQHPARTRLGYGHLLSIYHHSSLPVQRWR